MPTGSEQYQLTPFRRWLWTILHALLYAVHVALYRYRSFGGTDVPAQGQVLLVSNHQSFLDPVLVGLGIGHCKFASMARSSLFTHPAFGWLIRSLNAIPIERGEADLKAMRQCISVVSAGRPLLMFPEGTRTRDGQTGQFHPGMMLLIKRARPMIIPVAIDGAFDVWPRKRKLPKLLGRISVVYGQPIDSTELIDLPPDEAMGQLRDRVERLRLDAADRNSRRNGNGDAHEAGASPRNPWGAR